MKKRTTIFDDVFRTMVESMPWLMIPLINEVFHTSYPEDTEIIQLRNEHHTKSGNIITDTVLLIQGIRYHIECQTNNDNSMVIRMFQYDIANAIENVAPVNGRMTVRLDCSCVLYLRKNSSIPDTLKLDLILPDGQRVTYSVPTIKLFQYTEDDIFQKNLLLFLPYYILRYEKDVDILEKDPEKRKLLLQEYSDIYDRLRLSCGPKRENMYSDLVGLIIQILDYIFATQNIVRKELDAMGGKVLQLESEKNIEKGRKEGVETGQLMLGTLINRLITSGRSSEVGQAATDSCFREKLYREYNIKPEDFL